MKKWNRNGALTALLALIAAAFVFSAVGCEHDGASHRRTKKSARETTREEKPVTETDAATSGKQEKTPPSTASAPQKPAIDEDGEDDDDIDDIVLDDKMLEEIKKDYPGMTIDEIKFIIADEAGLWYYPNNIRRRVVLPSTGGVLFNAFEWLKNNATNNGTYEIRLTDDETLAHLDFSVIEASMNLAIITAQGKHVMLTCSESGPLFTFGEDADDGDYVVNVRMEDITFVRDVESTEALIVLNTGNVLQLDDTISFRLNGGDAVRIGEWAQFNAWQKNGLPIEIVGEATWSPGDGK